MGCITKHYLNEFSILGVWKIEEDLNSLAGTCYTWIMMKKRNTKDSAATRGNLNF